MRQLATCEMSFYSFPFFKDWRKKRMYSRKLPSTGCSKTGHFFQYTSSTCQCKREVSPSASSAVQKNFKLTIIFVSWPNFTRFLRLFVYLFCLQEVRMRTAALVAALAVAVGLPLRPPTIVICAIRNFRERTFCENMWKLMWTRLVQCADKFSTIKLLWPSIK